MREESLIEASQDISDIKCAVESIAYVDNKIDWEQRRYEIAKSAMQGMIANSTDFKRKDNEYSKERKLSAWEVAQVAVSFADALIAELKKTNETKQD